MALHDFLVVQIRVGVHHLGADCRLSVIVWEPLQARQIFLSLTGDLTAILRSVLNTDHEELLAPSVPIDHCHPILCIFSCYLIFSVL